jgi:hypothetical protein
MEPSELFAAMFELYNLASIILRDRPGRETVTKLIGLLGSDIRDNIKKTFMLNTNNSLQHSELAYDDHQVVDAFTRAGYTLKSNDEDENGWAPLIQVKQPSTVSFNLN